MQERNFDDTLWEAVTLPLTRNDKDGAIGRNTVTVRAYLSSDVMEDSIE